MAKNNPNYGPITAGQIISDRKNIIGDCLGSPTYGPFDQSAHAPKINVKTTEYERALVYALAMVAGVDDSQVGNINIYRRNTIDAFSDELVILYRCKESYEVLGHISIEPGTIGHPIGALTQIAAKLKLIKDN